MACSPSGVPVGSDRKRACTGSVAVLRRWSPPNNPPAVSRRRQQGESVCPLSPRLRPQNHLPIGEAVLLPPAEPRFVATRGIAGPALGNPVRPSETSPSSPSLSEEQKIGGHQFPISTKRPITEDLSPKGCRSDDRCD